MSQTLPTKALGVYHLEGNDFFEIYASVVQWITVCLMVNLEKLLNLKSKWAHFTAAILHATLEDDDKSYLKWLLISINIIQMEYTRISVSSKIFLVCIKFLAPPGHISLTKLETVDYLKLHLTSAYSLLKWLFPSLLLMILIFRTRNEKNIVDLTVQLHSDSINLDQDNETAVFLGVHLRVDFST